MKMMKSIIAEHLDPCEELTDLLEQCDCRKSTAFHKRRRYDSEMVIMHSLINIVMPVRNGKTWIAELEREEREKTGIKSLKIGYNRVFGYYIEITKANLASAYQKGV